MSRIRTGKPALAIVLLVGAAALCRSQIKPKTLLTADAGYVDPALCAGCHRQAAEDYARTGMGQSFRAVRADVVLPEFDGKTFHHNASLQDFTPYRKDRRHYLRRHQIGLDGSIANVLESEVHYVFGSGNHARSYLHRTAAGTLIELPLTWYAEKGGYWGMSPAYDRPDHLGFSREVTYRCLFCHNGYPEIEPGADFRDGATAFPERLPEGIDCQRCHGPGRNHVNAVRQGAAPARARSSIVNPSRLSSERQIEICMQCHLETTSAQLPPALLRQGGVPFPIAPASRSPITCCISIMRPARVTTISSSSSARPTACASPAVFLPAAAH